MPDVQAVLFEYMGIPVYIRLSLGCESTEVTRFQGSKGVIEMREFSVSYAPQAGVDTSPSYYSSSFPAAMKAAYVAQWHKEHDPVPGQEPAPETVTFNGNDYDDLKPHLYKFFQSVRSRQPLCRTRSLATTRRWPAILRTSPTSAARRPMECIRREN